VVQWAFGGQIPDWTGDKMHPEQLGQEDTTKFDAMSEALEDGEIKQEQSPCTYSRYLREIIELSDEDCSGALGRTLERQYK
jgi:hypothetical protein